MKVRYFLRGVKKCISNYSSILQNGYFSRKTLSFQRDIFFLAALNLRYWCFLSLLLCVRKCTRSDCVLE